jgi:pantetheine-phosphate adenylyltransferase
VNLCGSKAAVEPGAIRLLARYTQFMARGATGDGTANRRLAIYPGSFDPLTNGHLDIVSRASRLAERLVVAVLSNTHKQPLFCVEERVAMLRHATSGMRNVEVDSFTGLLVDYAAQRSAGMIVRGIRAISDYESELQMALINRRLRPETETVFLMAGEEFSFVSSRMIKEIIQLHGDVSAFVPPLVAERLKEKFSRSR